MFQRTFDRRWSLSFEILGEFCTLRDTVIDFPSPTPGQSFEVFTFVQRTPQLKFATTALNPEIIAVCRDEIEGVGLVGNPGDGRFFLLVQKMVTTIVIDQQTIGGTVNGNIAEGIATLQKRSGAKLRVEEVRSPAIWKLRKRLFDFVFAGILPLSEIECDAYAGNPTQNKNTYSQ